MHDFAALQRCFHGFSVFCNFLLIDPLTRCSDRFSCFPHVVLLYVAVNYNAVDLDEKPMVYALTVSASNKSCSARCAKF